MPRLPTVSLLAAAALLAAQATSASASSCEDYNRLRNPYVGELHVHTAFSFDSVLLGVSAGPRDAYRFARGAPLTLVPTDLVPPTVAQLQRPLDFTAVTDHAEFFGEFNVCLIESIDPDLNDGIGYDSQLCTDYRSLVNANQSVATINPNPMFALSVFGNFALPLLSPFPMRNSQICGPDPEATCLPQASLVWDETQAAAKEFNAPCEFVSDEAPRDDAALLSEAVALGLAADDAVLRNMLVQNMRLLLAREGDREPSQAELEAFHREHAERFQRPARLTGRHILLSARKRGDRLAADTDVLLERLRHDPVGPVEAEELGDPSAAGSRFRGLTRRQLAARFGHAFAAPVFELPEGEWSAPLASPLGLHLVYVERHAAGRTAALPEVREQVAAAWRAERGAERLARSLAELRARYEVVHQDSGLAARGEAGEPAS